MASALHADIDRGFESLTVHVQFQYGVIMPIKKIADLPNLTCVDMDHRPPARTGLPNGIYEHECPSCGKKTKLRVQRTEKTTVESKSEQTTTGSIFVERSLDEIFEKMDKMFDRFSKMFDNV